MILCRALEKVGKGPLVYWFSRFYHSAGLLAPVSRVRTSLSRRCSTFPSSDGNALRYRRPPREPLVK